MAGDPRYARRRQASGFLGTAFDEMFHPDAKAAREIWELQQELPAPVESAGPDDGRVDLDARRIVIRLPES